MGMGSAPCSGYVLEATEETFKKLGIIISDHQEDWDDYLKLNKDGDLEDWMKVMATEHTDYELTANIKGNTFSVYLFRYEAEMGDRYDDLTDGLYFAFNEEHLYKRSYTPAGQALADEELFPPHCLWTQFG